MADYRDIEVATKAPRSDREIGVPAAMGALYTELDRLHSNVEVLSSRLTDALLPEGPSPTSDRGSADTEPASHLRNSVFEAARQVNSLNDRLVDLLKRLDI